jgi:hypothetical protein
MKFPNFGPADRISEHKVTPSALTASCFDESVVVASLMLIATALQPRWPDFDARQALQVLLRRTRITSI